MSVSPTHAEKAERFRTLHAGPATFVIPNPWDVGTARILAGLGFKALATTSAGLSRSLGRRDGLGLVSRDEALAHARAIVEATDLPVSADFENGFGDDPAYVAETIQLAASVGLCGASIEDSTGDSARPIYDHAHAVERVAAAAGAARLLPHPFMLVARAENYLHGRPDLEDTLRRLTDFSAAGASVLYAPGLPDLDSIRAVCAAVAPKPVNALPFGKGRVFTVAELAAAGVRRISVGASLSRLALDAMLRGAREIAEKGSFGFYERIGPSAELDAFMRGR